MKTIVKMTLMLVVICSSLAFGQTEPIIDHNYVPSIKPLKLNGPRVGVTFLNQPANIKADGFGLDSGVSVGQIVSQFGWQFEWKYFETDGGSAGLVEFIPLIGGLDQGLFIPSANVLVGFRTGDGWEIGCGPNVSLVGTGFVVAGGYTFKSGYMNFPVNLAIIPGKETTRISLLVGWNKR